MRGPGNCQKYRQDPSFNDLKNRTLQYMWFDGLNRPIPVTCIFYPFPPRGEIVMQPPDFLTETVANQATNRNVTYYAVSITYMREVINSANYCNQPVYVFRTSTVPQDADPYGFFSQQQRIQQGVSTRELSADEIATACQEPPFAALCAKYGAPTGLVVTNKDVIPITRMYLKARTDSIVIAIANATCSYVEKDCEAIRKSGQSTPVDNSNYMIDPGQADAIQPFVASCEFTRDQGITKININDTFWQGTGINNDGTNGPFNFQFKNVYANATPAQVNSLSLRQVRMFSSSIGNNNINPEGLLTLYSGNTSNFGTPYSPGAVGCACGALDTCATPDLTCNCDARGPLTSDQGFITDSSVLPVVGFYRNIRSPSGRGRLSLTSVRCGPMWAYDMPKDCIEAYSLGFRYGINYTVSGEYLINPDNTTSSPFLVYCDYSDPTNPVTIVRPRRPRERVPVKNTTRVDYNGGPTDGQLAALLRISVYCYQPVRVALPQKQGNSFAPCRRIISLTTASSSFLFSSSGAVVLKEDKCNCDIGDDEDRSDAAILSIKAALPFRRFIADAFADGSLNLTVGNLYCASKPIGGKTAGSVGMTSYLWHYVQNSTSVNWASTTALHKRSVSTWPSGYECVCPDGWKGLGRAADDTEAPAANGRQCIDDNECLPGNNPCPPHNSLCANIPGSFICNCTEGYRNVDRLTCEDIDECAEKTHDCDVNAKCANTDGSFRCSCRTGFRGSGKRDDCSPVGQCTCFGDPHCLSFDKAWFHPQGGCENALVQNDCRLRGSATNPCPRFRVSTHHWNRGIEVPGVYAWIKEVKIVFGDNRIVLGQGGTIIVDGKLRSNMWSILSDDRTETIASVTRIGLSKVSMWTSCGLEVTWNGRDAVEILVPTSMMNKTCGMCGNYNGDKSDDWIVGPECPTLEGQQTNRQTLFSNSWTVNASQECTPDCNPSEPEPTCVSQYKSDYMCKKLFSETSPFANCLAQMPSDIREGLLFSCQFDLCHTNDTESTVCEVAETIANFCEEQMAGDPIVWRSPHLCGEPDCGVNEEFLICGPSEESTCNAPVSTYYQLCREGCFCVKGFRRQGDECLPESRCGCPYGEDLMKIGSQQVLNNCSLLVTCVGHEDHTEEPYSCSDIEECAIDDGIEACVCKEGTGTNSETGECIPGDHCAGNTECPATSECVTTRTSFYCNCSEGYINVDRTTCKDVNECTEGTSNCAENAECTNLDGGYTCNCATGYSGDGRTECKDNDECTEGTNDCDDNAECTNTDGGYNCTCKDGYSGDGMAGNCRDKDECSDGTNDCDVNAQCTNTEGGYTCACKEGYRGNGKSGNCEDEDECSEGTSDCDANAKCTNTGGGYTCTCNEGYSGDGKTGNCQDDDECTDGTNDCDVNAECTNEAGGYSCACKEGYLGDGTSGNCKDKDECREGTSDCDANAQCTNTEGGYTCTCNEGYSGNGTSGDCQDNNECTDGTNDCDVNAECTNEAGGYSCACKEGYLGDGTSGNCKDKDECREGTNNCDANAQCTNTEGVYTCTCNDGYSGNGTSGDCQDDDECSEGTNDCDENAECTNEEGGYTCACKDGYLGNGTSCKVDSDCLPGNNPCSENAVCVNTRQSFFCNCSEGYYNVDTFTCKDIDECEEGSDDCDNAVCINVPGSFECACVDGYFGNGRVGSCNQDTDCIGETSPCPDHSECINTREAFYCNCTNGYSNVDNYTCTDIDECSEGNNDCKGNTECTNVDGGYNCTCKEGYRDNDMSGNCEDEDECSEGTSDCDVNAKCTNTEGGYTCTCNEGYSGDGKTGNCRDNDECTDGTNDCDVNAECTNEAGGYSCACKEGYRATASPACEDEDECSEGTNNCDANAKCTNTEGGYTCTCNEGYSGNGTSGDCQDDDECSEGTNGCDVNAECTNEEGGYTCACKDGYLGDGTAGSCKEDDDCLPGNNDCSENAVCVNTRESYECNCTEGYRNKDARTCEDIDECEEGSNNCDENAVCTNVPGSYECACVGDYIGDGSAGSCTKDNDCAPESNPCPINAKCVNTRDGFYCNCSEGYRNVDSVSCEDSDECAEGTNDCDVNAECTNEPGTFRCTCFGGYVGDGKAGNCKKDDDCKEGNNSCPKNSVCVNTPDGFSCNCTEGYHNVDAVTCEDEDECAEGSHDCDVNAECTNLDGSYQCACNEGYTGDGTFGTCIKPDLCKDISCTAVNTECRNGVCVCKEGYELDCEECKDIDECANSPDTCGHIGQVCINTPGSYRCECVDGFYADGGYCHDINECEDGSAVCGQHSECVNMLGAYDCVCCMGYSKHGASCRRDYNLDIIYGAPGLECCNYPGGNSDDPIPVCASDGRSHANYAAMVVDGCRRNKTVEVSYKGYCKTTCSEVECDRPFQKCVETEIGAQCACPVCDVDATKPLTPVCGSNGRIYQNECFYQLTMCSMGQRNVQLRPLTYCNETHPAT
ncbi:LOW QUALITY PROTEIN: fibrillin-3-like [Pomacea canaliculata]|uniref:LOW QUALITY PROTEIN: fibrillin-3-like n=1 Tax=Pomacea canaliculata TaxID=400727 RepID=UPI000D73332B|nr:LOW QUALITY PROTEIN: fibrillin-3-like [Pomacea canaliculata]